MDVVGKWHGSELVWTFADGRVVSDRALRGWCFQNLSWPWCYPGCITQMHTDAWSAANPVHR